MNLYIYLFKQKETLACIVKLCASSALAIKLMPATFSLIPVCYSICMCPNMRILKAVLASMPFINKINNM